MNDLIKRQQDLIVALQEQKKADVKAEAAQHDYDAKLLEFEAANPALVKARDEALSEQAAAKKIVSDLRSVARKLLGDKFIDELPAGFSQKRTINVIYNRRDMRRAALAHFHHLLMLDEKAVDKFIKNNATPSKDHEDLLIVSDSIHDLVTVNTFYKPLPNISNATLLKLEISK
jgi:hypothetical protein